jgi:hypothetical protein
VAYYVSLGTRGLLLRIGTNLISVLGGMIYWRASRRRRMLPIPLRVETYPVLPDRDDSALSLGR